MCIFGDAAFPLTPDLQVGFARMALTVLMSLFNQWMSGVRISVEWFFGLVGALWPFVHCEDEMKVDLMPLQELYFCAILLTNCHSCFYGNQISSYFLINPPAIEHYLDASGASVPAVFL